jgi:hypothetical protein
MRNQSPKPTFKDLEVAEGNSKLVPSSPERTKLHNTTKMRKRIKILDLTVIVIAKKVGQTVKVIAMKKKPLPPKDSSK